MSDRKLVFPVKFDLDSAVSNASGDIDKALRHVQTIINAHPLSIKPTISDKELNEIADKLNNLAIPKATVGKGKNIFTAAEGSVLALNAAIQKCIDDWDRLAESERIVNRVSGEYTEEAKKIIDRMAALTGASETYAKSLQQIIRENKRAADAETKRVEKANADIQKRIDKSKQTVDIINAEENTLDNVSAKMRIYQQIANSHGTESKEFKYATKRLEELGMAYERLAESKRRATGNMGKDAFSFEKLSTSLIGPEDTIDQVQNKLKALRQLLITVDPKTSQWKTYADEMVRLNGVLDTYNRTLKEATAPKLDIAAMPEKSIADLTAKIQAYRNVVQSSDFGSTEFANAAIAASNLTTKLEGMNKAVADMEKWRTFQEAMKSAANTIDSLNQRISAWQSQMNGVEIGSKRWLESAENVAQLSQALQRATQWAQDFQQKAFQGLSSPILQKQVEETQQLRDKLQSVTEQFNRLQSAGLALDKKGNFTPQAVAILKQRADIIKQIADKTRDADSAQSSYEKKLAEEEAELKRLIELEEKRKKHLQETARILNANEQRIAGLNSKLQFYQSLLQKLMVGSDAWNKSALEVRHLSEELERANQRIADFQQKAFRGLNDTFTKGQVERLTNLRREIEYLDGKIHEIQQRAANGHALPTDKAQMNALLDQRIAKEKQIGELTKSASELALNRERQITEEQKKREELLKKQQARSRQKNILASDAKDIDTLTKKLQYYRELLNKLDPKTKPGTFLSIAKEVEKLTKELASAQQNIDRLTGKTSKVSEMTNEFRKQTSYVERLVKRMAVYASFGALTGFLVKIREVTAEFELQRVSLGAIIQDQQRANQLFGEIKSFALNSPLKILDLTKYTKQVAAYRIETDKLFDTTKRLADVSVGLGVDMSRIVLAYGQVRAASYLRAAEIRQFTEAGIPLLELLSEKFTQLQGSVVSTEEVMDKVSKRMVSFGMVEEIFRDMTDAGGLFYNMQEKQSQTLYGMWAKMGDAAAVMYDEIGNTAPINNAMKGLISLMQNSMLHWTALANVIQTVIIGYTGYKAAIAGLIPFYNLQLNLSKSQILLDKAKAASNIQMMAIGRKLTTEEISAINNRNKLRAVDYKRLINEGKLSAAQKITLARQAAHNKSLAKALISTKLFDAAQIRAIGNMSRWEFALAKLNARLTGFVGYLRNIGRQFVSFLPLFAITTITSLIADFAEACYAQAKAVKKVEKQYQETKVTLMELRNAYEELKASAEGATQSTEEMAKSSYAQKLEYLNKIIKQLGQFGMKNTIDPTVLNYKNIDPVIENWLDKLEDVNELHRDMGKEVAKILNAYEGNVMGWSLFGENLTEDWKDAERAWTKLTVNSGFNKSLSAMRSSVDEILHTNKDLYAQINRAVGMDAKLAIGQRRRNESELQYQQRIYKNFIKIAHTIGDHKGFRFNIAAADAKETLNNFEKEMKEVYHEFDKVKEKIRDQDALTVSMAISTIAAEHNWSDWQREALIQHLNKNPITLNAELIPIVPDAGKGAVAEGMKSIISTEFPTLFNENELKSLFTLDGILEAINGKISAANKSLQTVASLENKIEYGTQGYNNALKKVEQLHAEIVEIEKMKLELAELLNIEGEITKEQLIRRGDLEAKLADIDEKSLNTKREQIKAIVNQNEKYDEQITKLREAAKEELKVAEAAKQRIASLGFSDLGKDFAEHFENLQYNPSEHIDDNNFSSKFLFSNEDIAKIRDVGDLYDAWKQKLESAKSEKEKLIGAGINEATIAKERAELEAKQAENLKKKAIVEQKLAGLGSSGLYVEYEKLRAQYSAETNEENRLAIQVKMNKLLADNNDLTVAKLLIERQALNVSLLQNATAVAANKKIEQDLKDVDAAIEALTNMGRRYNFRLPDKDKGKGGGEDPWILLYKNRMKFMKDFQKGVEDLSKWMGYQKAIEDERANMLGRGLSLKIDSRELDGSKEELIAWYEESIEEIRKRIAKMGGKEWSGLGVQMILAKDTKSRVIKKYQELLADMFKELTDFRTAQTKKESELILKSITDSIARTKTAKDFYERILSQTGDANLAINLSTTIYGENGENLNAQIRRQIEAIVKETSATLDPKVFFEDGSLDSRRLRAWANAEVEALGGIESKAYQELVKLSDNAEKDFSKTIENWLKATEKAKSYSDKVLDLRLRTQRELDRINTAEQQGRISPAFAGVQRSGFLKKEAEEVAKLQYEAFKDSPMYVQMFDDLSNASSAMLRSMRARMELLKNEWKNLDPTQLKEMQSRLNEINNKLTKRNPFRTLADGLKEYRKLRSKGDSRGNKSASKADADLMKWTTEAQEAEKVYQELLHNDAATKEEIAVAKSRLDFAMSNEQAAQKAVENWKAVEDVIHLSATELFSMMDWAGDIAKGIADISEAMGADEEDVQYWNDISDALSSISSGFQDIINAVMNVDIMGIITSVITAIPKMFVGFFNIFYVGRIKRANKEIKKQQKILDELAYTYSRLEKAAEKALGSDYLNNLNQQKKTLEAEAKAYKKQAEAERSKGKKADKSKIKEYENSARDVADEIADMYGKLSQQMLGSDIISAARDFAQAWLEAYKEFGKTAGAMSEKFRDMVENMVVEGALARVMQRALTPMFDMIDNMNEEDFYSQDFWKRVVVEAEKGAAAADAGASTMMKLLEQAGISLRNTGSELTGIARTYASASESDINGLAAATNTQNFYMQQISGEVQIIRRIIETGKAGIGTIDTGTTDLLEIQQKSMDRLAAIERNTAETVSECRRIAQSCEAAVKQLNNVIDYSSGKARMRVRM